MKLCFAYNPTSWDDGPIPGGMADCHIQPVIHHLAADDYLLTNRPQPGHANLYYTHRSTYGLDREPGRVSIFAGHGIADKVWRNAARMERGRFDWVFTSGPAWTERLAAGGFPRRRILEVGYPKLDPIFQGSLPSSPAGDRIRVLWAPTHGGGGERHANTAPAPGHQSASSWWHRRTILDLLPRDTFDVVEAPHPRHRADKRSTLGEYLNADVVIADGGSTIYEAWALGLPVVFPTWLTEQGNLRRAQRHNVATFEAEIYRHRIGRHADAPEEFPRLIEQAAEHGITEPERRFIEPIFPMRYRGVSGQRAADALRDIASGRRPTITDPAKARYRHQVTGRVIPVAVGSTRQRSYDRSPAWTLVED